MIRFFIHRKVTVAMIFIGLSLLGLISYNMLPVELFPNVEYPNLIIRIMANGEMNPEYVEREAVIPAEGIAGTLEGVAEIESYIDQRGATITLKLDSGTDIGYTYIKLLEKSSELQKTLPDNFRVTVAKVDLERLTDSFMTLQVRGSGGLERVRAIIEDTIQDALENIDGVSFVEIIGGRSQSMEIVIDEEQSRAQSITPGKIASLITGNSSDKAFVGHAYENDRQFFVNVSAEYTDVSQIENIVVDDRGPILLRDIADISFGLTEEESISRVNGMDAVTMRVMRDPDANLIDTSHEVTDTIEHLNSELSHQDIEIVVQTNTADDMETNIDLIKKLAVTGGLLAVSILWLFLRNIRLVLIVLVAIPVSVLTAFNFLYAFGISINSLTLIGMALAIGMLLDNSIVVLENVYRHVTHGASPDDAAHHGTSEVWRSIFAATLTTITVFLPFAFSTDEMVSVVGYNIGITIITTLAVSLAVALLLVPAAVHAVLKRNDPSSTVFARVSGKNRLIQLYTLLFKTAVRYPGRTIGGATILFFISIALSIFLNLDVATETELKEFELFVTMKKGSTLEQTDVMVTSVETTLREIPEIKDIISTIYEEEAGITVVLHDDYETIDDRSIAQIKGDIQNRIERFYAADVSLSEPRSSRRFGGGGGFNPMARLQRSFGIGTPEEKVVIRGNDYEIMQAVADGLNYQIEELDTIQRSSVSVPGTQPEVHILFDHILMNRDNITYNAVSSELSSFRKQYSTTVQYHQGNEDYEIVIRNAGLDESELHGYDDLAMLDIEGGDGAIRDLEDISSIIYSRGLSGINRTNQEKQIEVVYRFVSDVTDSKAFLESARMEIDDIVAGMTIPAGIGLEVVHDETDISEFYFLIAAAFILIYMILASVFESATVPLIMMYSIPLATLGSFTGLIITGNSIKNHVSLIGLIILIGVVVNNGIILIDYAHILRRRGMTMIRALMQSGRARVRPIMITAITTIVAMVPLAMGKGEYVISIGAPFAITVIGGLVTGTLMTLIIIPTAYASLESTLAWFGNLNRGVKLMQTAALAFCTWIIWNNVSGYLWMSVYFTMALAAIPAFTWFVLTSLRRTRSDSVASGEKLTINIRRIVKIYDNHSRISREWNLGKRMAALHGDTLAKTGASAFEGWLWQLPLLAFMIYFVYYYLSGDFWQFVLAHIIYFFGFMIIAPIIKSLANHTTTFNPRTGIRPVFISALYTWGIPAFNLAYFRRDGMRTGSLVFILLLWYGILTIHAIASYLHRNNINIMRLKGRFAGFRRVLFSLILMIPFIGRRKRPFNALDGVTLTIGSGMFGLLGPNGAGKTTIMRVICGILDKSMGTITFNDLDFTHQREELQGLIGYLPQDFGTYENMSAYEFLDYIAILKGMHSTKEREARVRYVLESVHLYENRDRAIGSFSGGMKQRVGIALSLLHLPRILVVDEPTAGLDPRERIRFRNLLVELSSERIVIFSTHIIEDISSSCNNVAVLNRGELRYLGNPRSMTDEAEGKVWQFVIPPTEFETLRTRLKIVHHMRSDGGITVRCISDNEPYPGSKPVKPTLEDAYLWLLGGIKANTNINETSAIADTRPANDQQHTSNGDLQ